MQLSGTPNASTTDVLDSAKSLRRAIVAPVLDYVLIFFVAVTDSNTRADGIHFSAVMCLSCFLPQDVIARHSFTLFKTTTFVFGL